MLDFIKGSKIKNSEALKEGYSVEQDENLKYIRANVSAKKILKLIYDFVDKQKDDDRLFLFIEVPCNLNDETVKKEATEDGIGIIEEIHNDVYYLDGIPKVVFKKILDPVSDVLINDGLVNFGVGNHFTGDEIGKYKYNEMFIYLKDETKNYQDIFEKNNIPEDNDLIRPWDIINEDNPGEVEKYSDKNGMDIYNIIKIFQDSYEEFYKAGVKPSETKDVVVEQEN